MPTIHHIMLGMFTNCKEKKHDTLHMNVQELELQHENYTDAGVHSITTGECTNGAKGREIPDNLHQNNFRRYQRRCPPWSAATLWNWPFHLFLCFTLQYVNCEWTQFHRLSHNKS